ncbi:MAG: aminotransferase class I/II-fold pyridoxal phosphate-dependent enzyme [Alphaproteobacteria bacterium]|nr:aminotransferase class I/II-fold pyridoxal phosphate-dependent enzyme [Alphaproteobacteria bacterium]
MFNPVLDGLPENAFPRLANLIAGIQPGGNAPPILMSLGEPQHPVPDFIGPILASHVAEYGKYPPIQGTDAFREAVAGWLNRRFELTRHPVRSEGHILPLNGTREGLFSAAFLVTPPKKDGRQPAVLMPNPFYQCYAGAALAAGAEPTYLDATRGAGFLPDIQALSPDLLSRTSLFYMCSPANPQGSVASIDYLKQLVQLARQYDFVLALDECYSEIYTRSPPPGGLRAASDLADADAIEPFANVLVFHSLSKRSNLPGLRSGFVAGDTRLIARFRNFRAYVGPTNPLPADAAATAAWRDEAHVEENRRLYRQKFDAADEILNGCFGYFRPAGGFFLWLDAGDGEAAALKLWREAGVKVLPGKYLARGAVGDPYIRVALVGPLEETIEGLRRIWRTLGSG